MKRRILALFLAIVLTLGMLPTSALAAETDFTEEETEYVEIGETEVPETDPPETEPPVTEMEETEAPESEPEETEISETEPQETGENLMDAFDKAFEDALLGLGGGVQPFSADLPADADFTEVYDQAGLAAMKAGGSFRLAADIRLDDSWAPVNTYAKVVLDGRGHTVTLSGAPLFDSVPSDSLITSLILDGSVTGGSYNNFGALANASSGEVRNCISRVRVTYTGGNPAGLVGGFVGDLYSGSIYNCYSEAAASEAYAGWGAIANVGSFMSGTVSRCYAMSGPIGNRMEFSLETFDDELVPMDPAGISSEILSGDADLAAVAGTLNKLIETGDAKWTVSGGTLTLENGAGADKEPADSGDIAALKAAVDLADSTAEEGAPVTPATWAELQNTLAKANALLAQTEPEKEAVQNATDLLYDVIGALERRTLEPLDPSGFTPIATADELSSLRDGGRYVLTADIDLSTDPFWMGQFSTMNCVLDGGGHTVTLKDAKLWGSIGPDGVVQNLGIQGSVYSESDTGALAKDCSGLILNCWSRASVKAEGQNNVAKNAGGMVASLTSGGAIVNCCSTGELSAKGQTGALAGVTEENTLVLAGYWLSGRAVGSAGGRMDGCQQKSRSEFYSDSFIALLNENRGDNGRVWGVSAEGWPYHGADQGYQPSTGVQMTFTPWDGGETVAFNTEDGLTVSLLDICQDPGENSELFNWAGNLSCAEYPDASWSYNYTGSGAGQRYPYILAENGKLVLIREGTCEAYMSAQGLEQRLAFPITVTTGTISDLRVLAGGTVVSDGTGVTAEGSEDVNLTVQGMVDGSWKDLPSGLFSFTGPEELYINGGIFHAKKPGSYKITVAGLDHSAEVSVTSTYVPVTRLVVHPHGTYSLHERGPMGGGFNDLTLEYSAGTVSVEPANASCQEWTLTSSDPSIAEYVSDFVLAVQPYKAGTVTLTATSLDDRLEEPVTASSEITLVYKNPLTSVEIPEDAVLTVKENESISLNPVFTGKLADYHVSETGMNWTFEGDGKISIEMDGLHGVIVGEEGAGEYCVSNPSYLIRGEAAGSVTVTGTPWDQTAGAKSVSFTVNVISGTAEIPADNDKLVEQGIPAAQAYLEGMEIPMVYGSEWNVFSMTRSGKPLEAAAVEAYLASVKEAYQKPGASELKPTTLARVALTLTCLGVDASDFEGLNFISMLCTSSLIPEGGNEPMWALIAMDSGRYPATEDGLWNRDSLITELLKFQNDAGYFGLSSNQSASTDLTGMAVQALAPYYHTNAAAKAAVDKALQWLKNQMDRSCDYGSVETTAQVLVALTALGLDPLDTANGFVKSEARNLITAVCGYQNEETGAFQFAGKDNNMATCQGLYALESYRRHRDGENRLFDLTDILDLGGDPATPVDKAQVIQTILDAISEEMKGSGSDWNVVDMAAYGMADQMDIETLKNNAEKYVFGQSKSSTNYERIAISGTAAGIPAGSYPRADGTTTDLLDEIANMENLGTINGYIFALNAYDCGSYTLPEGAKWTRDAVIEQILQQQLADGGWTLFGSSADPDITGMTVTALSLYRDRADVSEALDRALTWMSESQLENGGYKGSGPWGVENSNSASMMIVALAAMDIDADRDERFIKNGHSVLDALLAYRTEENRIGYTGPVYDASGPMATEQGFRALVAYTNWQKTGGAYYIYDFTPKPSVNTDALAEAIAAAEALKSEDYTAESFESVTSALNEAGRILADPNATQEQADKASKALTDAMAALTIEITFRLVGDDSHGTTVDHRAYTTWIPTTEMVLSKDSVVYDAFAAALEANGMDFKETQPGYIGKIQAPAVLDGFWLGEFDNGIASGWMYTVSGETVNVGLRGCPLRHGDEIVWHYVDDYTNDDGSWKDVPDTAPVAPEKPVNPTLRQAYESTAKVLQNQTPIVGSVGGEWAVLGLARSEFGVTDSYVSDYYAKVLQYVQANINDLEQLHGSKSTDNARLIVALTAIGKDPANVGGHNLLKGLTDLTYLKKQGLNGPIWALIAFDTNNYSIPGALTRETLVQTILDAQLPSGGWPRSSTGTEANVDITAMALYALAPYLKDTDAAQAVNAAIDYLSEQQSANGGFDYGDQGQTLETCAQVITALSALGIDAAADGRFVKDGSVIDAFLAFCKENGGFNHNTEGTGDEQMATEQAFYAMAAYFRNQNHQNRLFDMSDVEPETPAEGLDKAALASAVEEAKKLQKDEYTETTWNALKTALEYAEYVLNKEDATQDMVNAAAKMLNEAVKNLEKAEAGVDKSALAEAIKKAEAKKKEDYTTASWNSFNSALTNAKGVYNSAKVSQAQVDEEVRKLNAAMASLVEIGSGADKSKLQAAVDKASTLVKANYTTATWNPFAAALTNAKGVLANDKATQAQVDEALDQLTKATAGLKRTSTAGNGKTGDEMPLTELICLMTVSGLALAAAAAYVLKRKHNR